MTMNQTIDRIARHVLNVETLTTRNSDCLDFHDLAVWSIKEALTAAFQAGVEAGYCAMSEKDVSKLTGLRPDELLRMAAEGEFPEPVYFTHGNGKVSPLWPIRSVRDWREAMLAREKGPDHVPLLVIGNSSDRMSPSWPPAAA